MSVTIIDCGSGNLRSAAKAFEAAGASGVRVSNRAEDVLSADRIVLPGQGSFTEVMKGLASLPGMIEALRETVLKKAKPFFGICVGMQLLADKGAEHGGYDGLGFLGGEVNRLEIDASYKLPHMGWNSLQFDNAKHPLVQNLGADPYVYFVHSYAFTPTARTDTLATCTYGQPFTAMVARGNIAGTQFHPEKSQKTGLQLIRNFLEWKP
jgi:imidazole glycerol-phosphate synthase subunit HisH